MIRTEDFIDGLTNDQEVIDEATDIICAKHPGLERDFNVGDHETDGITDEYFDILYLVARQYWDRMIRLLTSTMAIMREDTRVVERYGDHPASTKVREAYAMRQFLKCGVFPYTFEGGQHDN
jgi:hypothetical protein